MVRKVQYYRLIMKLVRIPSKLCEVFEQWLAIYIIGYETVFYSQLKRNENVAAFTRIHTNINWFPENVATPKVEQV